MRRLTLYAICGLAGLIAQVAAAHHGWVAYYDRDQRVTVQGVVREVQLVNPHSFVYIDTVNEDGEAEVRWCELQARTQLERRGVTQASFEVGAPVTVEGFASRRDPLGCETGTIYLVDGQVVTFRHPNGQSVYGAPQVVGDLSILGTWYPKEFLAEAGSTTDSKSALTPEGEAAHKDFDWITQNPTLDCSPASNIRAWAAPGLPSEIRREGNTVIVHHEFMDVVRVIELGITEHSADAPRTDLGHSIGRFEGRDLVIETARFRAGALWAGRLNTGELRTTERLTVDVETGDLRLDWTATDPAYYSEPLHGARFMTRTDIPMGSFDCVPEAGHQPRPQYRAD